MTSVGEITVLTLIHVASRKRKLYLRDPECSVSRQTLWYHNQQAKSSVHVSASGSDDTTSLQEGAVSVVDRDDSLHSCVESLPNIPDSDNSSQEDENHSPTQTNSSSTSEDCDQNTDYDTDYDTEHLDASIDESITTNDLSTATQLQADIRSSGTHGMQYCFEVD